MSTSMRVHQRAFRGATRTAGSRHVSRNRLAVKAGLFDFLKPAPAAPKQNPRARELADELLQLCEPTDAGLKASPALRERIEELAEELSQYCIKNPVKSPLLWGEYQVVYTANAGAIAGPFRKGAGMTIFPGQVPKQILQEPNVFINDLQYKTLGFLSGYARQYGEIEFTSGSTFKVVISRQELNTGAGLTQNKDITAFRNFEVIYLDEDIRVTRFLPVEGLRDDERDADGAKPPAPPTLFVFKRVKVAAEEEEAEVAGAGGEEEAAEATTLAGLRLPGTKLLSRKRLEGAATLTERQVRRQMEADSKRGRGPGTGTTKPRGGTGSTFLFGGSSSTRPATPEPKRPAGKAALKRADAKAAAAQQKQEAAAEKEKKQAAVRAAAEKQRREAEAAAAREKQAAIRDLLAQLAQELKEKAAAKKDALSELRSVERSNANVLKAAAAARSKVEAVAASAANAEEALAEAKAAQQEAAGALRGAEAELKEVQKGTQKVLAGTALSRR